MFQGSAWREPVGVSALIAALALCVYAVARLSAARFYGPLGVRVEDLRTGYPGLIEQSLGSVVFVVAISMLLIAFAAWTAWMWISFLSMLGNRIAVVLTIGVIVLLAMIALVVQDVSPVAVLALIAANGALMVWRPKSWLVPVAGLGVVVATGLFTWLMWTVSANDAEHAQRGITTQGRLFGAPLVPWRSDVARLEWRKHKPSGLAARSCVLVLGAAEGETLVYATDIRGVRRTLTVTRNKAIIQVFPDKARCADWPKKYIPKAWYS
jgi:hypothetical protein